MVWTPLKKLKVSWDDEIPNIWKVIKLMFQTTNQLNPFPYGFPMVSLWFLTFIPKSSTNLPKQGIVSPHPGNMGDLGYIRVSENGVYPDVYRREHDEIHQSIFGDHLLRQFDADFRIPQNMEALYQMKPMSWGHIPTSHSPLYKPDIWWVAP